MKWQKARQITEEPRDYVHDGKRGATFWVSGIINIGHKDDPHYESNVMLDGREAFVPKSQVELLPEFTDTIDTITYEEMLQNAQTHRD